MYYNTKLFKDAGLEAPASDWDKDTFLKYAQAITKKNDKGETEVFGYAWTNRLWGSWMPWIFVNNGGLLTEEKAPGGEWMWDTFYKDDEAAKGRGGGYRWLKAKANEPAIVEALEFMVMMTKEGIAPSIELGGGATLQGFFTDGKLGMTPAGGFWSGGLHNAGLAADAFDVQLFPKWKSQRHQFGTGGKWLAAGSKSPDVGWQYLKVEISKEGMEGNGIFTPFVLTTPSRRSMCNAERFAVSGPKNWAVFYDTLDKHPDTGPIPAPVQSNPMTQAFVKYTGLAMTFEMTPKEALDTLQTELEAILAK
jgi:ABC-type glycerol-3-phosphate transport system substrate-binding protein